MCENKPSDLYRSLGISIFGPLKSPLDNITDLSLETIIESEMLREIPIINSLLAIADFGINISDRYLAKKIIMFLKCINDRNLHSEPKFVKHRETILSDETKLNKEMELIYIMLDRFLELEKAQILANFYISFVNEEIDWTIFCELNSVLDRLILSDIQLLNKLYDKLRFDDEQNYTSEDYPPGYEFFPRGFIPYGEIENKIAFSRILSLGLAERELPQLQKSQVSADNNFRLYDCSISDYGVIFFENGFIHN